MMDVPGSLFPLSPLTPPYPALSFPGPVWSQVTRPRAPVMSNVTPCHHLSANQRLESTRINQSGFDKEIVNYAAMPHPPIEVILSPSDDKPEPSPVSWAALMCPLAHSHVQHSSIWILCLVTKWKVRQSLTGWEISCPPQDFYQNKHEVKSKKIHLFD